MAKKPTPKGAKSSRAKKKTAVPASPARRVARSTPKPAKRPSKTAKTPDRRAAAGRGVLGGRRLAGPTSVRAASGASKGKTPSTRRVAAAIRETDNRVAIAEVPIQGKAERALTRQDIDQFRQLLLQKRAEILGDVSTLHNEALNKDRREAAGDLSSMPIHMADLGTDNYELEFTLGLIEGERTILKEIDEALDRIQQGTYGICVATGRPIGKARLRAKPWAKHCYEYALAQERGQGRRL